MQGQSGPQPAHAGKGAAGQRVALQDAEPVLDRVQPGRAGRGEMEVEVGVGLAPGFHLAVPVDGVVVQDQVHLPGGETLGWLPREGQEFLVSRSKAAGRVKVPWRTWSRVRVAVWTVVAGRSVCVRSRACIRGLASTDRLTTPGSLFSSTATTSCSLASKWGCRTACRCARDAAGGQPPATSGGCGWAKSRLPSPWTIVGHATRSPTAPTLNAAGSTASTCSGSMKFRCTTKQWTTPSAVLARAAPRVGERGRGVALAGPGPVASGSAAGGFTPGQGTRGRPPLNRETDGTIAGGNGA